MRLTFERLLGGDRSMKRFTFRGFALFLVRRIKDGFLTNIALSSKTELTWLSLWNFSLGQALSREPAGVEVFRKVATSRQTASLGARQQNCSFVHIYPQSSNTFTSIQQYVFRLHQLALFTHVWKFNVHRAPCTHGKRLSDDEFSHKEMHFHLDARRCVSLKKCNYNSYTLAAIRKDVVNFVNQENISKNISSNTIWFVLDSIYVQDIAAE